MAAAPSLPGLSDAAESIIFWNTQHFDPEDGMEVEVESYAEEYAPREAKRTVAARLQEMAENVFLCEVIGGGKKFGTKGYPSRRKQKAQLGVVLLGGGDLDIADLPISKAHIRDLLPKLSSFKGPSSLRTASKRVPVRAGGNSGRLIYYHANSSDKGKVHVAALYVYLLQRGTPFVLFAT